MRFCSLLLVAFACVAPTALSLAAKPVTPKPRKAPSPRPLTALLQRDGSLTVRDATGALWFTARPGVYEATWQYKGFTPSLASPAEAVAKTSTATVTLLPTARVDGSKLFLTYAFTPDHDTQVNSAHVSLNLPLPDWLGAPWAMNQSAGTVPARYGAIQLTSGETRDLTLTKGMRAFHVNADAPLPVMIQDNRAWSDNGDLELRVGAQYGEGHTLKAGETETVAFTLVFPQPVQIIRDAPMTLQSNANWTPLDLNLDVERGSALDFSFLQDAPAGKHGRVLTTPQGHFAFAHAPGKPVRFYGVNLCFSANIPDNALADRVADRLARLGYNTVRIHHYESSLLDPDAPNSLTFVKENLDRLDYLFAALKKRGIYMKTDLFVSRPVRPDEAPGDFKMATLVSDKAMANWKAFSKLLLEHINPYTHLAYKDDPALAWLSLVNEPNAVCYLGDLTGELGALYDARWAKWSAARHPDQPAASLPASMPRSMDSPWKNDLGVFLTELHMKAFAEMDGFLKREIGTKALVTYLNGWAEAPPFMAARTDFDWVDNHFYWDHPNFLQTQWNLPSAGGSGGGSAVDAGGAGPPSMVMTRLQNKPFSVSEFNYAAPNPYRVESGLLMGAASALQDWDAVWRFAYSHSRDNLAQPGALGYFDMATDPVQQASERAAVLLFLRHDVKAAPHRVTARVKRSDLLSGQDANLIPNLRDFTWLTRVGVTVTEGDAAPPASGETVVQPGTEEAALAKWKTGSAPSATPLPEGVLKSETGEITLDSPKGLMRLDTPRTAGGIAREGDSFTAGPLSVTVTGARAAVWASSVDGAPLKTSRRILLIHGTDDQNTGARYSSREMKTLEAWGGLPHLLRNGTALVTLAHAHPDRLKAWRLDTSGHRVAALPVKRVNGGAQLRLSTRAADGKAVLYYEIAEK